MFDRLRSSVNLIIKQNYDGDDKILDKFDLKKYSYFIKISTKMNCFSELAKFPSFNICERVAFFRVFARERVKQN